MKMNNFIDKILLGIFMLFYKQILIERRSKGFQIRDYRNSVLKTFIVEGLQLYFHAIIPTIDCVYNISYTYLHCKPFAHRK